MAVKKGNIRLPSNVKPAHYELFFDLDLGKFTFSGREDIRLEVVKPTRKIILHSSELEIKGAFLECNGKTLRCKVRTNKKLEQIALRFGQKISSGTLHLEFSGRMTDNLAGVYRSKYSDGGKEKYLVTTQFEAPYARRAFPCFDEPAMKATFDLALRIDKSLTAISNMPVKHERVDGGKKVVSFHRTPVMSTYLLYFGAGEFEMLKGKLGKTLVRIICTPGKKSQGKLALDLAGKFLSFFEKYSGIPYPLPKLDLIAIPDFAAGAMENWGAITFREVALLFDPKKTSVFAKKRIAVTIAHELWHQWSGNLVTMKWWNDTWLNESFATYMAYKATDHYFPEWRVWEDFIVDELDNALDADSIKSTHSVEVEITDPHMVEEVFDAISYDKGGSVLRMVENYMGTDAFRKGVSKYLNKYRYANAEAQNLWSFLSSPNKPVKKIVETWIKQPGYPLVTAFSSGGKLNLSQKRFVFNSGSNSVWPIPVSVQTEKKTTTFLMHKKEKRVPFQGGWFKLNYGQTGFFRTKYGERELSALRPLILSKKLNPVDRWGIHSDMFRLCRHGEIKVGEYLDFLQSYRNEDSYIVLSSVFGSLQSIHFVFSREDYWDRIKPRFNSLFADTFSNALERLGWEPRAGESEKDALLRNIAIRHMGFVEHRESVSAANEKFENYLKGKPLHPNIRSAVFAVVAASGDGNIYDELLKIYETTESIEEKRQALAALGSIKDHATLEKVLDFSLGNKVRVQELPLVVSYVSGNPVAREILLDWAERNWKRIEPLKRSHFTFLHIIESLITAYVKRENESELKEFFGKHPVEFKLTLNKSFDRLRRNMLWRERNSKILEEYFARR